MGKVEEASQILLGLGFPAELIKPIVPITFLAVAAVGPSDSWGSAIRERRRVTKELMRFAKDQYGMTWQANTRESVRKDALHQLQAAHIVDANAFDPNIPTNSSNFHYSLSPEALLAVQAFNTESWSAKADAFIQRHGSLADRYAMRRSVGDWVPVTFPDGKIVELSPGDHNAVQKAVIEEFAPRFAPNSKVLYLGDTIEKGLIMETDSLLSLGYKVNEHDKLPDIILYRPEKNWLYLVEAVTSRGPMTRTRVLDLEKELKDTTAELIFVTAFPDRVGFRKHVATIAWETEVWIADSPTHLIHFNGNKFLGPHIDEGTE